MAEQGKTGISEQDTVQNFISDAEKRNLRPSLENSENVEAQTVGRASNISAVKDGLDVSYLRNGHEIFRDTGERILLKPGAELDSHNVEAALRLAAKKFGDKGIVLNGTDEFKLKAMETIVAKGIDIKFSDKSQAAMFEAVKEKHGAKPVGAAIPDALTVAAATSDVVSLASGTPDALTVATAIPNVMNAAPVVGDSFKSLTDSVRKNGVNPVSNIGTKMTASEYSTALQKLGGEGVGRIELPKEHCGYRGKIIQASDTHIVQKIDKNFAIAHDVTKIANGKEILALAEKGQLRNADMNVNYNEKVAVAKAVKFNVDDAKAVIANSNAWAAKNIASPESRAAFGKIVQDLAAARTQAQIFKAPAPVQVAPAPVQSPTKPQSLPR